MSSEKLKNWAVFGNSNIGVKKVMNSAYGHIYQFVTHYFDGALSFIKSIQQTWKRACCWLLPLPLTPEPAEGEFDWGLTGGGGVGVEPGAGPIGG